MKALCVFSGGLDSMLAAQIIRDQDIEVLALFFKTPFFGPKRAFQSAESIDLPVKVVDITERHLKVVKAPKYGHGEHMNPCIDCHALMFRVAGEMMAREGAQFIITGEVLGQRPMSQNRRSLDLVARESGMEGLILRPLSAKLLPKTIPEEKGWVKRELLLDFRGRSRKPQMELARRLGIKEYPSPAGGCLLTEEVFSRRLKDLLDATNDLPSVRELELLKLGRHFRVSARAKVVVGRNKKENQAIQALKGEGDLLLHPVAVPGPAVLLLGRFDREDMLKTAGLVAAYSDAPTGSQLAVRVLGASENELVEVATADKSLFREMMI